MGATARVVEVADMSGRAVTWAAIGLCIIAIVVIVLAVQDYLVPPLNLQRAPNQNLKALREQKASMLNSYAWVDKQGGIVQIPVDRAMDLIVQKGLPAEEGELRVPPGQDGQ